MKNATWEVRSTAFDERDEKLDRLYQLIEDIEVAMLTTRGRDGSLVSRPMATQRRAEGAHFWFVAEEGSPKIAEIVHDPNVNLSYYKARTKEWVSVSGVARISRDRSKIRELYEPTWKVWFPDQGGNRNGGPDDPRILLIGVEARSAHFTKVDKTVPMVLFDRVGRQLRRAPDRYGKVEKLGPAGLTMGRPSGPPTPRPPGEEPVRP
jgi:general stress protein 26